MGREVGTELEFFGGPHDGERHWVARMRMEFYFPEMDPIPISREFEPVPESTFRVSVYKKQAWRKGRSGPIQLRMVYQGEKDK